MTPSIAVVANGDRPHLHLEGERGEFSLRALVRECIGELERPDLDALVALVDDRLPEEAREAVYRRAFKELIRQLSLKPKQGATQHRHGHEGSPRWEAVAQRHGSGALSIYRWWINFKDRPPKFLGDCTPKDVADVVAGYKRRAIEQADHAQRYQTLLREMRKRRVETVHDVPVERLVEIFNA